MSASRSIAALAAFGALALVAAECPNACSGHGDCTKYDQCLCYRNWQGNDCSLRTCQFGMAHVDSPKGDLDGNNWVSASSQSVLVDSEMYPVGTTEQFPDMSDSAGNDLDNTAHGYMECSNKGLCDRKTGTCTCFTGYEGVACQRASCNLDCNGHGVCKTIRELSLLDGANTYELWDQDVTMGCQCDKGWYGADCTQRTCKRGTDPLYIDATVPSTVRTSVWRMHIAYPSDYTLAGNYSIRFFDRDGEDWFTDPIAAPTTTGSDDDCDNILAALRSLPNKVVPSGADDVTCSKTSGPVDEADFVTDFTATDDDSIRASRLSAALLAKSEYEDVEAISALAAAHTVISFDLSFPGLPGVLRQPEVEFHLDSVHAPTLYTKDGDVGRVYEYDVLAFWSHGATIGEDVDHVANLCQGVTVKLTTDNVALATFNSWIIADQANSETAAPVGNAATFLKFDLDPSNTDDIATIKKLKLCLGTSDFDVDNNMEVYNWDYGSDHMFVSPHLIKLVPSDGSSGGRHAMLAYVEEPDTVSKYHFVLMNDVPIQDDSSVDITYNVYTTDGVLEMVHKPDSDYADEKRIFPDGNVITDIITALGYYGDRTIFTSVDTSCQFSNATYEYPLANSPVIANPKSVMDPFFDDDASGTNVYPCLKKGDIIYLARPYASTEDDLADQFFGMAYEQNPDLNPYVIQRVSIERFNAAGLTRYLDTASNTNSASGTIGSFDEITAAGDPTPNRYRILVDKSLATTTGAMDGKQGILYRFSPPARSSTSYYHHTAECSNRGLCDADTGLCTCFKGYTNDNCDTQSALAV